MKNRSKLGFFNEKHKQTVLVIGFLLGQYGTLKKHDGVLLWP